MKENFMEGEAGGKIGGKKEEKKAPVYSVLQKYNPLEFS
jgi:hypothetical protein